MSNYFEKIDDFLLGKMNDTDKQDFEKEMAKNPDLSDAVAIHQLERRAVHLDMRDNLRAEMARWRAEKKTITTASETPIVPLAVEKGKVVPLSRRIFQWAAAAVIVLAVGFMARWAMQPTLTGLEIAQKFYDEPSFTQKGRVDTSLIVSAEQAIEQQKDYKKALSLLEKVQDTSLTIRSLELKAYCHYKLGDFVASAANWQTIMNQSDTPLSKQPAEWHWLLMKLAANQRDVAFDDLLKRIEGDVQHQYQDQAIKLQKMLH